MISIPLAAGAILMIGASLTRSQIPILQLYGISSRVQIVFWASLVLAFVWTLSLAALVKKLPGLEDRAAAAGKDVSWVTRIIALGIFIAAASSFFQGFTYVHPESHSWISTSKAGRREVTETIARDYLWLGIRFNSALILGFALAGTLAGTCVLVGQREQAQQSR